MKKLLLLIFWCFFLTSAVAQRNSDGKTAIFEEKEDVIFPRNIQIYPNPATEYVKIDFQATQNRIFQFRLYNVIGNDFPLVVNQEQIGVFKFDVKNLPSGYYWILVMEKESNSRKAFKFLKK